MATFEKHIPKTLQWEGGYANVKGDRGALTYSGITKKNHPTWEGWLVVESKTRKYNEIIPELDDEVKSFYKKHYWDKIRLGEVCNEHVAGFLLDWFVNSGNHAIKAVQKIVGTTVDGIIGSKTIEAINNYDNGLFEKLKMSRIGFVKGIVKNNPDQAKFLDGWLNRISSFK